MTDEVRTGWLPPSQFPDVQPPPWSAEVRPPSQQESPPRQEPFRFRPEEIAKMRVSREAANMGRRLHAARTEVADAQAAQKTNFDSLEELLASQRARGIKDAQRREEMARFMQRRAEQRQREATRKFQTPEVIKAHQVDRELLEEKRQNARWKQEAINRRMLMGGASGLGLAALGGLSAYGLMRLFGGKKKEEKKDKKKVDKPRRPSRGRRGRSGRSAYKKGGVVKKTVRKN